MIKIVRRCQTATASRDVVSVVRVSIAYAGVLLPILEARFAHGRAAVVVTNCEQEHGVAVLTVFGEVMREIEHLRAGVVGPHAERHDGQAIAAIRYGE